MTMPKSKLGFLLVAIYVFITGLIFIYAKFACSTDALYCGMLGFMPLFPTILLTLSFNIFFVGASPDIVSYLEIVVAFLINVILFYFIGSAIQKKFSQKTAKTISLLAIGAVVVVTAILGVRYFNKSDIWKPDNIVNVNNPVNSGNYCQQDSDCVLAPQYQGCCPNGCEVEAVNVETKKRDKEARNKICGIKDYSRCKMPECAVPKQAVCEQNRCVVKEKQIQNPTSKKQYKIIGSFTSPGESSFVKAMGIIVYLTDISEGLLAIDVSNPEKPILLSKIKIGNGGAYALSGNFNFPYVIVSGYGNNKVALGRVGHTGANEIVESTDAKRTVQDIVMEGDYIYLAIDGPEIEIMKVERGPNFPYDDAKKIINKGLMKVEGGGHINTH